MKIGRWGLKTAGRGGILYGKWLLTNSQCHRRSKNVRTRTARQPNLNDPKKRLEEMTEVLRSRGHRITPQRLIILNILAESKNHPGVEHIYETVRKDFPTVSLATVYKTMTLLKSLGEVLELGFADSGNRYDGNMPYPHPHVICTRCRRIVDPEPTALEELSQHVEDKTGFRITHHRLDFYGLCPYCQEETK